MFGKQIHKRNKVTNDQIIHGQLDRVFQNIKIELILLRTFTATPRRDLMNAKNGKIANDFGLQPINRFVLNIIVHFHLLHTYVP